MTISGQTAVIARDNAGASNTSTTMGVTPAVLSSATFLSERVVPKTSHRVEQLLFCIFASSSRTHSRDCEFQKWMRLREAKSVFFHRSGCDCVQKSMRPVLEYTKVVATSFVPERQDRLKFE